MLSEGQHLLFETPKDFSHNYYQGALRARHGPKNESIFCIIWQCSHHHPHLRVRPCDQSTTIASANCLVHTFPILVLDKWKPQWWKLKIHRFRIETCEICVTLIFISWAILRFWDKFRGSYCNKRLISYYHSSDWQKHNKHIAIAKEKTQQW